jgi:translation initiation factor IF-1
MAKNDPKDEQWGIVTEALPALRFRVLIDDTQKEVIAYLSGRMHRNFIRVLIGDKVKVFCPPQSAICRLTQRPSKQ